jgi:hypothetical protein
MEAVYRGHVEPMQAATAAGRGAAQTPLGIFVWRITNGIY